MKKHKRLITHRVLRLNHDERSWIDDTVYLVNIRLTPPSAMLIPVVAVKADTYSDMFEIVFTLDNEEFQGRIHSADIEWSEVVEQSSDTEELVGCIYARIYAYNPDTLEMSLELPRSLLLYIDEDTIQSRPVLVSVPPSVFVYDGCQGVRVDNYKKALELRRKSWLLTKIQKTTT